MRSKNGSSHATTTYTVESTNTEQRQEGRERVNLDMYHNLGRPKTDVSKCLIMNLWWGTEHVAKNLLLQNKNVKFDMNENQVLKAWLRNDVIPLKLHRSLR